MDSAWAAALLQANLLAHAVLLAGAVWCIAFPARRIYPMTKPDLWYVVLWLLFALIFVSNPLFVLLDWNSGPWSGALRFWLGIPVALLGAGLVGWGIATLGARRTSGLVEGLVATGPYRITRNPQYVGDLLLFVGVAILANSEIVWVTHLLTALVLLTAPFAEEPWLEEQYGDAYLGYRREFPRFL